MPFLVDFRWLNEACAFLAGGHDPTVQTPCILENSIGGAWADGDYIVVKHHECQTATETKDRATYQVAIDHVESAKVRSAVGLCRRRYLGN